MADLKTKQTGASVDAFVGSIKDERRRQDSQTLLRLMKQATRCEPKMWGASIVGFGSYHYKYASGREGNWMLTGFSPRKQNLTVYIMSGFATYGPLLKKLGPHTKSVSCLYLKRLDGIDLAILKAIVKDSVAALKRRR